MRVLKGRQERGAPCAAEAAKAGQLHMAVPGSGAHWPCTTSSTTLTPIAPSTEMPRTPKRRSQRKLHAGHPGSQSTPPRMTTTASLRRPVPPRRGRRACTGVHQVTEPGWPEGPLPDWRGFSCRRCVARCTAVELFDRDTGEYSGGLEVLVPEVLRHVADVRTTLQHQGRRRVAEKVAAAGLVPPRRPPGPSGHSSRPTEASVHAQA